MGKRIPPKGTPEYRAYWRDRHVLGELKTQRWEIAKMLEQDPPTARKGLYEQSLAALDKAIELWDLGHQLSYT